MACTYLLEGKSSDLPSRSFNSGTSTQQLLAARMAALNCRSVYVLVSLLSAFQ